jgi:ABC-2 type transport system permease protein
VSTGAVSPAAAPGRAVTLLALRQVRRGGLVVVVLAAGMTALVTATYGQVMADPAAAGSLAALAGNPAVRILFGAPVGLDTAGGFTVWRVGTFVAVLLAAWSVLATTRITRGEEEAGRWDLLLAGRVTVREVTVRHLAAVMIVPVAAGSAITGVLLAAGTAPAGALTHGAGTGLLGVFFVAVAALAAQVFPARSAATGTAVAVLGAGLLTRMIGDGVAGLRWWHWLSPFGLLTRSGPYVRDRLAPLLTLLAAAVAITVLALAAAGRREVRGGLVASGSGRRARLRLLGSLEAFAVRRALRPFTGWALGIGAYYLLIGTTAVSITGFLTDNPALADQAAAAGFGGLGDLAGFTSTLFAILAIPAGGFAAVRMGAFVTAETDRRLTLLAAQPVSRGRLLGAEIAATAASAAALVTVAGSTTWVGILAIGGDLDLTAALRGAWNPLPIVALSLGAAVFAVGWAPRRVGVIGALPATGGFLLLVLAESVGAPAWVREVSPFAHLAPVPLTGVNWTASAAMLSLSVLSALAGAAGYRRRDLRS